MPKITLTGTQSPWSGLALPCKLIIADTHVSLLVTSWGDRILRNIRRDKEAGPELRHLTDCEQQENTVIRLDGHRIGKQHEYMHIQVWDNQPHRLYPVLVWNKPNPFTDGWEVDSEIFDLDDSSSRVWDKWLTDLKQTNETLVIAWRKTQ